MPSTSNKLSSNLENNLPNAMNTLAMGLADSAPPPFNAIGMSLIALLWPSSSSLPTTMEHIIEAIETGLTNQTLNAAKSIATGIQSYIDTYYGTDTMINETSYSDRLNRLETFNQEFFLHIVSVVENIEDNIIVSASAGKECKTLLPLITWGGWHLSCLQEMALMDVKSAPDPQQSIYLTAAKHRAQAYVNKINTIYNKYFKPPSGESLKSYTVNGEDFVSLSQEDADKKYNNGLKNAGLWVSDAGPSDLPGALIPKVISSLNKFIKNPLPTSSYGLQRFVCYTKNKTDKAGNEIQLYYYGPEDEQDKAPPGYTVNAGYYGASFWAWKKRPPIGTVPVYLLQLGDVYWFSKNKETGSGWTFLGVAFYAFITADLDKAKALGIEYVELLCGGYTPKDEYQQYFFTTTNDDKLYPPQFSQPSTSLTGPFYVPTGNDYHF